MKHALLIAALALAFAGCSDPRERAGDTLKRVGVERVRHDAALLYKSLFARHGADYIAVRAKSWPPSFQEFAPVRVGAYRDGISLAIEAWSGHEAGIYIVPATMEHQPSAARGGRFERLAEGVYWYSFGD